MLLLRAVLLGLVFFSTAALRASDDVVEKSDVLVPDGIFGTMRKVDSKTLILPEARAVIRQEQRRTAIQESRARAEAERQAAVARVAATPRVDAPANAETALVEESVQTVTTLEEPSMAVAEPAPIEPAPEPEPEPEPEAPAEPEPTPEPEATNP
jgi:hypothetical protein